MGHDSAARLPLTHTRWPWFRDLDLGLLILGSSLAAGLALSGGPTKLRIPLGIVATLFLPGYAWGAALFPRASDLRAAERAALSLGLSAALIVSVIALALNYTTLGLSSVPAVLAVTLASLLGAGTAYWRRRSVGRETAFAPSWPLTRAALLHPGNTRYLALVATALGVIGGAFLVVSSAPMADSTQFYLLGPNGLAQGYPTTVQAGQPVTLTVGVSNRENLAETYHVEATSNGLVIADLGTLTLEPNATWQGPVSFSLTQPGSDQEVDLELRKGVGGNDGEPYRSLRLLIDVSPASAPG